MKGTQISICTTLRRYGAPTKRKIIKGKPVFTLTTGRTSAANLIFLHTEQISALLGILKTKLSSTLMHVGMDCIVQIAMDGKSLNTTQIISGNTSVIKLIARISTALNIISRRKGERIANSLSTCLDVGRQASLPASICLI